MTVQQRTMYVAQCDYPRCEVDTSDFDKGNNILYDKPEDLTAAFGYWEGGLDDWGWLLVEGRHYCGDHTVWDDEADKRVPKTAAVVGGESE
ncbi:MAG TPA: hypothetical protein VN039_07530 [Nitrospira sp.]|jgi:hypothetical protein|nr:hypothetical protein [Nitrospira sp.]